MSLKQVYDFLYVDVNRIARLVAQLDGRGLLKETVRELTRGVESEVKLKIPWLPFSLKGQVGNKREDHHDPTWRLPVLFLDEMEKHIVRDPSLWAIGQIVTLTGSIAFRDFAFAAQMLQVTALRRRLASARARSSNHLSKARLEAFSNAAEVMPHMLQAIVSNQTTTTWSTLNDACTTASTGDLTLKCGGDIEGLWTLTGILDAKCDGPNSASTEAAPEGFLDEFRAFGSAVRTTIGRPPGAFGITPLTIYRKVEVPDIGA